MTHSDWYLFFAVIFFAAAAVLRILIVLNAIDLKKPIDGMFIATGLTCLATAFLVT